MSQCCKRVFVGLICAAGMTCAGDAFPQEAQDGSKVLEGLWHGSWGGGEADGVVYQPVLAELVVEGNEVQLHGFREAGSLTGTLRVDALAKRMEITPAADNGRSRAAIFFNYALDGDILTLTDAGGVVVTMRRLKLVRNPVAGAPFEIVKATGMDESGNLLMREFVVLQADRSGTKYYRANPRTLNARQAAVYLVEESGVRELALDDARERIREASPVVIAYHGKGSPAPHQLHTLWKDEGPPRPDSEIVLKTVARVVRTGTLVFIFPAREIPLP